MSMKEKLFENVGENQFRLIKESQTPVAGNSVMDSGEGFNFLFRSENGQPKELGYGPFSKSLEKFKSKGNPVRIKRGSMRVGGRSTYNIVRQLIVNSENKPVGYLLTASDENAAAAVRDGEIFPSQLTIPVG